jgi:hypothetical protein
MNLDRLAPATADTAHVWHTYDRIALHVLCWKCFPGSPPASRASTGSCFKIQPSNLVKPRKIQNRSSQKHQREIQLIMLVVIVIIIIVFHRPKNQVSRGRSFSVSLRRSPAADWPCSFPQQVPAWKKKTTQTCGKDQEALWRMRLR